MKIKKFEDYEKINEIYNLNAPKEKNKLGFNVSVRTYIDDVFDHVVEIIREVQGVSEKSFKKYDEIIESTRKKFDDNQEIIDCIKDCESKNHRCQYSAEIVYDKFFK